MKSYVTPQLKLKKLVLEDVVTLSCESEYDTFYLEDVFTPGEGFWK